MLCTEQERISNGGAIIPIKVLNPNDLERGEDWEGNNAAFTCPICQKVFIVSDTRIHIGSQKEKGCRKYPTCLKSVVRVNGGRKSGGTASIEW
jgi:hypothetical protein